MSPIASFEEEKQLAPQAVQESRGMSAWLVKKGLAKNRKSADLTLLVAAGIALALAVFLVFQSRGTKEAGPPPGYNLEAYEQMRAPTSNNGQRRF